MNERTYSSKFNNKDSTNPEMTANQIMEVRDQLRFLSYKIEKLMRTDFKNHSLCDFEDLSKNSFEFERFIEKQTDTELLNKILDLIGQFIKLASTITIKGNENDTGLINMGPTLKRVFPIIEGRLAICEYQEIIREHTKKANINEYLDWLIGYLSKGGLVIEKETRTKEWWLARTRVAKDSFILPPRPDKGWSYDGRGEIGDEYEYVSIIVPEGLSVTCDNPSYANKIYRMQEFQFEGGRDISISTDFFKDIADRQMELHTTKATEDDYLKWSSGYLINGNQFTGEIKESFQNSDRRMFVAKESFKLLPADGTNAIKLIVPKGIQVDYDELGDNTIYMMDDYSVKGNDVPIFNNESLSTWQDNEDERVQKTSDGWKDSENEVEVRKPYMWKDDE